MTLESAKDYSWYFAQPGKLAEFYASFKLHDGHGLTVEHPVFPLPTAEEAARVLRHPDGLARLSELLAAREKSLALMDEDPLHYGYEWPWYNDARWLLDGVGSGARPGFLRHFPNPLAELLVLAGNDTGKSWFGAKWSCEQLEKNEEIDFIFGHMTEDTSKDQQQQLVYKFLPPSWRGAKRGHTVDTSHKGKTGFTDNKFVVKKRRGLFLFYAQQPGRLTGYKIKGAWADELITLPFLEELRARMFGRDGRLLLTFTPVDGYTPAVAEYLAGAEVVEYRPSQHLPGQNVDTPGAPRGHMPYILKCRRQSAAVICAFSEWSPFRKPEELLKLIEGKSRGYIKQRLYGFPERIGGVALPKFGPVNIIRRAPGVTALPGPVPPKPWENLYPTLPANGMNTVVLDPAEEKNWVIKWYRHTREPRRVCVYREWPDLATCGEWAIPGDKHDGAAGPAQRYEFGHSILRYKRLMLQLEGWVWDDTLKKWDGSKAEKISRRMIDARFGGSLLPSTSPADWAEGNTEDKTIIQWLNEDELDLAGNIIGPGLDFLPAPGEGVQGGLQKLADYFDYNVEQPVTAMNSPKWFVVEDCEQSILCYRTYTGLDKQKGHWKDFVDPDRYLVKSDAIEMDDAPLVCRRRGSY